MTNNNINAHCSICGKGYYLCSTCKNEKKFKPWRTVTDTIEHYKIYMAIHGYTVTQNKEIAKAELQNCDLSDMESFKDEIKSVIKEIVEEPDIAKSVSRTRKNKITVESKSETELEDNKKNETVHKNEEQD